MAAGAVDRLFREEHGHIVATLIRLLGNFDLAEEAAQEAFAAALVQWPSDGTPANPRAWLIATARHKAVDRLRRARLHERVVATGALGGADDCAPAPDLGDDGGALPDDQLRLFFTCCHPALAPEAQVALTLRTLAGLTTEEIARAFLVPTATMAQRLVRAKGKIQKAGIPYHVPGPSELGERLEAVMAVVYLVFNEGYAARAGEALVRHELCAEAIRLGRLLRALLPPNAEVDGLLALMLLHDARRASRVDGAGDLVLLEDQDRSRWDAAAIAEGRALAAAALALGPPGPYLTQAVIAAEHARARVAADTDWRAIAALYGHLLVLHPSPVVALNRAVAVAMTSPSGLERALPLVDALAGELGDYHLFHAARADLLRRLGRVDEAAAAYRRALALATQPAERRFLTRRLRDLGHDDS